MAIRVQIPGPLRSLTGGAAEVEVEAGDVAGLIEALEARHRGIRERLLDASGELRSYVRVFVDDRDVRTLHGKATALAPGATVAIVPAIAGGRACHGPADPAQDPLISALDSPLGPRIDSQGCSERGAPAGASSLREGGCRR
jgi:molybdopterin synthase sulfur carrier subunit